MIERLKEILREHWDGEVAAITLDCVLTSDLGMDSMQLYDLVCAIEDTLDIEIPDRMLPKFVTVGDVVDYLEVAA
ncbi:MAG: acyl carrier protein [Firmicutes bacterium]|nr:acyl carrier protein [Bacillota bacterium]